MDLLSLGPCRHVLSPICTSLKVLAPNNSNNCGKVSKKLFLLQHKATASHVFHEEWRNDAEVNAEEAVAHVEEWLYVFEEEWLVLIVEEKGRRRSIFEEEREEFCGVQFYVVTPSPRVGMVCNAMTT